MSTDRGSSQSGFSLIETLVAIAILLAVVVSGAQLFGVAARANQRAATRTVASLAAGDKIEQLRSTPWPALVPSPPAALDSDVDGYSDRLGGGSHPALLRRWSIAPLPPDAGRLIALQVVVLGPSGRIEARIATVRRKAGA